MPYTGDILSSQSDSTFPLVIVSPEGLNEVGTPVADEPRADTGLGLIEVTTPETDGSCGATRSVSTEQRCFDGLALESQEVHADPGLCSGSVLGSIRELRADPESGPGPSFAPTIIDDIVNVSSPVASPVAGDQAEPHVSDQFHSTTVASDDPVCEADPYGLGSVPTSSGHDSLREELGEASLHNDVQSDLGMAAWLLFPLIVQVQLVVNVAVFRSWKFQGKEIKVKKAR
ncbi:hypothetical protein V6N13_060428 [Hibiscus sabdariffa]